MRPSQSLLAGVLLAVETVAVVAFFAAVRLKYPALIVAREANKKGRRR